MNLLLIKLSAVGDVVHTLPSLSALRRLYPQAHVTWVVEEGAADLLMGHPDLDRVLVSRRKSWMADGRQGHWKEAGKEAIAFMGALPNQPYDLVIDFHGLFKSAVLAGLSGGRRRLGYASLQEGSRLFYNETIPEDMNKHAVDRYLDFLRHLGAVPGEPVFTMAETDENRRRVMDLLEPAGIVPGRHPFVAINPVALWETKLWDRGKFAALADAIGNGIGMPVVLTGSAAEKPYLDAVQASARRPLLNLAGKTSLRDLAALYRLATLVVTTDSGPMHIAAAVGTPTVALFGPTDPKRTGPYGKGHTVISLGMPCSPCFRRQCPNPLCMGGISVERVYGVVEESLTGGREQRGRMERKEKNGCQ